MKSRQYLYSSRRVHAEAPPRSKPYMSGMIFESESDAIPASLPLLVTGQCSDYVGADNAGLHVLLLRRTGSDEEGDQKGTTMDFRTIKSVNVVKDLYGVLAWVEKMNARAKE